MGKDLQQHDTLVVKIGSNALVDDSGHLDANFITEMSGQLAALTAHCQPVLVSSGAVACGMALSQQQGKAPTAVSERQALAAIGQADLIHRWQVALAEHGVMAAQVLLTADDFHDRLRFVNLMATLRTLFEHGVIPIINENDAVSVQELTLGDNDRLSALVACQLQAKALLLLSDIDGCYDKDPRQHQDAKRIPRIDKIGDAHIAAAGDPGLRGTGGMRTKLEAARIAARAGVDTMIARARDPDVIAACLAGEEVGTLVPGRERPTASSRRRWLAWARHCKGILRIDEGAAKALQSKGRSLLAVGVTAVEGSFKRGDTVAVTTAAGEEVARGLVSMSADDLNRVKGLRAEQAAKVLGRAVPKNVVHRDNILLADQDS